MKAFMSLWTYIIYKRILERIEITRAKKLIKYLSQTLKLSSHCNDQVVWSWSGKMLYFWNVWCWSNLLFLVFCQNSVSDKIIIIDDQMVKINMESFHCLMVNELYLGFELSEFEIQSSYYVHFGSDTLRKVMNL